MRKLFFIIFLFICSQIVAQSPIPTYIVGDTTILAAYAGTNTLAAVKDTGVTGGMYIYDATGTYVPDGSAAFVTSVKGGIWLHITPVSGGGNGRFAIEDNTGITNRLNNFQGFNLELDSVGVFNVNSGDLGFGNKASYLYLDSTNSDTYVQSQVNKYSEFTVHSSDITATSLGVSNNSSLVLDTTSITGFATNSMYVNTEASDSYIEFQSYNQNHSEFSDLSLVSGSFVISGQDTATNTGGNFQFNSIDADPDEGRMYFVFHNVADEVHYIFPDVLPDTSHYIPISVSVNGGSPNYADNTGNIDITDTSLTWTNLFSGAFGESAGLGATTTGYLQMTGRSSTYLTEVDVQFVMSEDFTMSRAFVRTTTTQPNDDALVITLRKNGSNTSLVVTIPANSAAGTYSDVTHTVSISAGDVIDWQVENLSSSTAAKILSIGATGIGQ